MIISWVNGQFEAWCPHLTGEHAFWRCPERIEQIDHWGGALKDAIRFTKYDGSTLEIVMAHPQLTHQLVETPPIKGMMLQRFLKRQVDKVKTFPGNAAWAWQSGRSIVEQPHKEQCTATVHFMPEEIVQGLTAVTEKHELHLLKIVPLTEILLQSLRKVDTHSKSIMLMAASAGNDTMVVVSEKTGPLYVVRTLKSNWRDQPEQMATDLNRTMLYIQQTFGVEVAGVWVMGVDTEKQEVLTSLIHSPLHCIGEEKYASDWVRGIDTFQNKGVPNLVNSTMLRAPQLRMLARVAAVVTGLLTLSAVLIGSGVEYVMHQAQTRLNLLEPKLDILKKREMKLASIQDELNRKRATVNALTSSESQRAPHWMLAYLGEAVPVELQITEYRAENVSSGWEMDLSGLYHGTYQTNEHTSMEEVMSEFKRELNNGPFHFKMKPSNTKKPFDSSSDTAEVKGHWMIGLSRVKQVVTASSSTNRFRLKGVIQ
jgi:hypothetical protein